MMMRRFWRFILAICVPLGSIGVSAQVQHLKQENFGAIPTNIAQQYPDLESFVVWGNDWDTKLRGFPPAFYELKKLKKIDITHTDLDSISPAISQLTSLEELHVRGNRVRYLPNELAVLQNLGFLGIDEKLKHLPTLPRLKHLHLVNQHYTPLERLPYDLSGFERLEALSLYDVHLGIEAARVLARLPRLETLHILGGNMGGKVSQDELNALRYSKSLKNLFMRYYTGDMQSWSFMVGLERLWISRFLDASGQQYVAAGTHLTEISKLPFLKSFTTYFVPEDLSYYPRFSKIKLHLVVEKVRFTQEYARALSDVEGLESLDVDEISPYLSYLHQVRYIGITALRYEMQPSFWERLANMPKLAEVRCNTRQLQAGVAVLKGAKNIAAIACQDIPDEATQQYFREALPNIRVRFGF